MFVQEKRLIGMYHKLLQFGKEKKIGKSDQSGPKFPCLILCVGQNPYFSAQKLVKFAGEKSWMMG
jgi:hypothetical protein